MKRLLFVAAALLCACGVPGLAQIAVTASLPNYATASITATSLSNAAHSATGTIPANGKINLSLYGGDFYTFSVGAVSSTYPAFTTGRTLVSPQPYSASTDISQALAAGASSVYVAPAPPSGGVANLPISATYGIKTDSQGVASPILVRPYDATNPPPQTTFDNSATAIVSSPQPGHAVINVPTLSPTSPGVLTGIAPGAFPTLSMLGSTGSIGDAFGAYNTSQALKGTNVNLLRNLTYTGAGWSYGTGATYTTFLGQGWAVDQPNQWNVNFNKRAITQMLSSKDNKNAIGDDAFIYAYLLSVGGSTAGADEGQTFLHGQTGELPNYPQGVVASSSATGLTALSITPTLFNAAGTQQFCDGCMLVQKAGGISGHYTGTPTKVQGANQALYYNQPVDITLTPSIYGTLLGCPAAGGGSIPQATALGVYRDDVCTISAAQGAFPVGPITIAGQNTEQASITNVSAVVGSGSGATQSVTLHHKEQNSVGNTTIWAGGPQGSINMPAWPESIPYLAGATVGMPIGNVIYGATDAHTLAMGTAHLGSPDAPTTFYNTLGIYGVNQYGTTVQAYVADLFNLTFNNLAGAVVSGCGNAIDGVIPGTLSEDTTTNVISWTSSTSTIASCNNATLSLPPAMTAFTNYPYAEQTVADPALPVYYPQTSTDPTQPPGQINPQATGAALAATRTLILEANHVPWQNGAQIIEVHPNAQDGNSIWVDHGNANPSAINQQTDLFLSGTGVATGRGSWMNIYNESPYSWYAGAGGLVRPKPFMDFYGPNSSSEITLPMNGDPMIRYDCPAPDPTCKNVQKLWMINNHTIATWIDALQKMLFPAVGTSSLSTYFNNTDLAGELNFSAASTATFTVTSVDSVLHPIVVLQCEFNCNGNQPWPTYSGNAPNYTITANFATPVTGTVSYMQVKRTR